MSGGKICYKSNAVLEEVVMLLVNECMVLVVLAHAPRDLGIWSTGYHLQYVPGWSQVQILVWPLLELNICMKLQFMNMPVAPESRSVDMETDVSKAREVSSTWMLREQGEFLDRM